MTAEEAFPVRDESGALCHICVATNADELVDVFAFLLAEMESFTREVGVLQFAE